MTAPVEVRVFPADGTGAGVLVERRDGVRCTEELNGVGSGEFTLHLDDEQLAAVPALRDPFSIVKFKPAGAADWLTAWQLESDVSARVSPQESAGRRVTLSGRQVRSLLDRGRVLGAGDQRNLGFSALDLPGYPGDWDAPVGVTWAYEATARANSPADWPDPTAMWLWSSNPEVSAPAERNWFRAEFTLDVDTNVVVMATCDNSMSLHVDGIERITTDAADLFAWRQSYKYVATLPAGEHSIAAWVDNAAATTTNPGGFLCIVAEADDQGAPGTVLLQTNDTDWVCRPADNPPGWFPGAALDMLLTEAQAAGDLTAAVTWDFTGTLDSNGDPWERVIDEQIPVGEDLLTTSNRWAGTHYDIHMTPDLVLQAFIRRGGDLSADVELAPDDNLMSAQPTRNYAAICNVYRLLTDQGWIEVEDSASVAMPWGRRVGTLSLGSAGTVEQAVAIASDALNDTAWPQVTVPVTFTSAKGPQVGADFDNGDTILAPAPGTGQSSARCVSWTLTENDNRIDWTTQLYPEAIDPTETPRIPPSRRLAGPNNENGLRRLAQDVASRTPGLGRIAAAAPVVPQRLEAKLRGKSAPAAGGDSDHDGTGADSTAVGTGADASGHDSAAVGDAATASNYGTALGRSAAAGVNGVSVGYGTTSVNGGVAVGESADASGAHAVAVGQSSESLDYGSVAIGLQSKVDVGSGVAIGYGARSQYDLGVAVGMGCAAGYSGVAIGDTAKSGDYNVAIGKNAGPFTTDPAYTGAGAGGCVAIGQSARTRKTNSIAIGINSDARETQAIAVGRNAVARAVDSIAIGYGALVGTSMVNGIAIGKNANAADNSIAIGPGAFIGVSNACLVAADSLWVSATSTPGAQTSLKLIDDAGSFRTITVDSATSSLVVT